MFKDRQDVPLKGRARVRYKLWVGVGAATLISSQAAGHEGPRRVWASREPVILAARGGQAGEGGGAGGEQADYGSNLPKNLRLFRDIELIRGHLLIGRELVDDGLWADALPHFLHPTEEIYPRIRRNLPPLGIAPFAAALKALAGTVKTRNQSAYGKTVVQVERVLADAERRVQGREPNWPPFAVETVLELLRSAAGDYAEAIEGGRIVNRIEYQDARGFVLQAEKLFASVSPALAGKDGDAVRGAEAGFAELKKAWPSPNPPAQPVNDLSVVLADMSRIELQVDRFR